MSIPFTRVTVCIHLIHDIKNVICNSTFLCILHTSEIEGQNAELAVVKTMQHHPVAHKRILIGPWGEESLFVERLDFPNFVATSCCMLFSSRILTMFITEYFKHTLIFIARYKLVASI